MKKYFEKFKDLESVEEKKLDNSIVEEKLEKIVKAIKKASEMSFRDALAEFGSENIATIYDLARIRELFFSAGKIREYTTGMVFGKKGDMWGKSELGRFSYQWTGEYLGKAEEGHPAKGHIILSKIEAVTNNEVVPSKTRFAICDHLKLRDSGYITDFEERDGLMVPITDLCKSENCYDIEKDMGFGPLFVSEDICFWDGKRWPPYAVSCRPFSASNGMGIHGYDTPDFEQTIITKDLIRGIIE